VKTRTAALLLAAVALGGLTACGASADQPTPQAAASPSAAVEAGAEATQPAPQQIPTPPAPQTISLTAGTAVVDGKKAEVVRFEDRIVYRFEADDNKPSKVNCDTDCLIIWPPLLTDGSPVQLSGVDEDLVGTVTRADGLTQVTLDGWPLYLFKNDQTADDTLGEGVGGNWSVIRPDGKPVVKK
jgi:predicted lipoprotein with Yx(FWY)xxD motif